MDLKEKLKILPSTPGVYLMKDSEGSIIYVGKSKNLKSRVSSYFHNSKFHSPKVERLVKNIKDLEYIVVDTEFEAFLLECRLIKDIKPYYNKKMKNPLSYAFIQITSDKKCPDIKLAFDSSSDDGGLYFGPYTGKNTVERAITGIKECCKICCSNPSKRNSPCLNFSIGLCLGICLDDNNEIYKDILRKITGLLRGTDLTILNEMEKRMRSAAAAFDFETAAKYRDYVEAVNSLISKEKVIEFAEENKNIVMVEKLGSSTIKYFFIKGNRVLFKELLNLENSNMNVFRETIINKIITHFKDDESCFAAQVTKDDVDEAQIIFSYLKNSRCEYIFIRQEWLDTSDVKSISEALKTIMP